MLGFGFGEIVLIVVVAIIILGPDKLPNALIEIVKMLKVLKRTVQDAKETLDREVNLAELKREALDYKETIQNSVDISKDLQDANPTSQLQKNMNEIKYLFDEYQPKKSQDDINAKPDEISNSTKEELKQKEEQDVVQNTAQDLTTETQQQDNSSVTGSKDSVPGSSWQENSNYTVEHEDSLKKNVGVTNDGK